MEVAAADDETAFAVQELLAAGAPSRRRPSTASTCVTRRRLPPYG
ncbi:hypothetical protein [Streptomyces sp. DH10]|nr:hypothetical protein [Streptomyces sp. DH10]MDG9709610.1 hypothetical protein [Streptomyces sp. DH10]